MGGIQQSYEKMVIEIWLCLAQRFSYMILPYYFFFFSKAKAIKNSGGDNIVQTVQVSKIHVVGLFCCCFFCQMDLLRQKDFFFHFSFCVQHAYNVDLSKGFVLALVLCVINLLPLQQSS